MASRLVWRGRSAVTFERGDRVMLERSVTGRGGMATVVGVLAGMADTVVAVVLDELTLLGARVEMDVRASLLRRVRTPPRFASQEEADAWLEARPCADCGDPEDHGGLGHLDAMKLLDARVQQNMRAPDDSGAQLPWVMTLHADDDQVTFTQDIVID